MIGLKATAYGTLCLTALSLCWAAGGGSKFPPPMPGQAPGYFGKKGRGPTDANDVILKEYNAKK